MSRYENQEQNLSAQTNANNLITEALVEASNKKLLENTHLMFTTILEASLKPMKLHLECVDKKLTEFNQRLGALEEKYSTESSNINNVPLVMLQIPEANSHPSNVPVNQKENTVLNKLNVSSKLNPSTSLDFNSVIKTGTPSSNSKSTEMRENTKNSNIGLRTKFTTKEDYENHIKNFSLVKRHKCNDCGKMYSSPYRLRCHAVKHTGQRPYKCDDCGKSFVTKFTLKSHIFTHMGYKPYKCKYCAKSFCNQFYLKVHIRSHTGEKPFVCNHCDKAFARKSYLDIHIRNITGKRRFKCEKCDKSFSLKHHLEAHLHTHTREKPFKCEYCKKSFSVKFSLTKHLLIHTGEKQYECDHCGKKFYHKTSLPQHIRIHIKKMKKNVLVNEKEDD